MSFESRRTEVQAVGFTTVLSSQCRSGKFLHFPPDRDPSSHHRVLQGPRGWSTAGSMAQRRWFIPLRCCVLGECLNVPLGITPSVWVQSLWDQSCRSLLWLISGFESTMWSCAAWGVEPCPVPLSFLMCFVCVAFFETVGDTLCWLFRTTC